MMNWVFPLIGTGCLAAVTGLASIQAVKVFQMPPPALPDASIDDVEQPRVVKSELQSRNDRADVYYAAVTERPLFAPSRRPVSPEAEPPPEPEPELQHQVVQAPETPEPPGIKLHGVITTSSGPSALLSLDGSEPEWLAQGADVQGWNLRTIGDDWVILMNNNTEHKVDMY